MSFYTDFPKFPTSIFNNTDYPTQVDDTNTVYADLINALKEEIQACFTELGTLPKGYHASVKARIEALEAQLKVVLDYFEYADDAAAQLAYVSSDATPVYGSDILTGGTASASSEYGGTYSVDYACDNNETTRWSTTETACPHWWKYDLGAEVTKIVQKVRIKTYDGQVKDFKLQGSNNDSDWDDLHTGQHADDSNWEDYVFSNSTAYRYYRIYITTSFNLLWGTASIFETEMMEVTSDGNLQCYSEDTIKEQGSYSLKVIAVITDSLNDTLTRTIDPVKDLTGKIKITLWARSDRTGENFKVEFHDSGGNTIAHTVDIDTINTWEKQEIDVSVVDNGDKDSIDQIKYTIINADAAVEMYLDNNFAT